MRPDDAGRRRRAPRSAKRDETVVPFQPAGMTSSREWIQIDRAEAAEYGKDLALFQASLDYVKAARGR